MWFTELLILSLLGLSLHPKAAIAWSGNIKSYSHVVYSTSSYCSSQILFWCAETKYVMQMRTEMYYRCAPGWIDTNGDQNCVIPICNPPCQNGGTCVAPNKCACLDSFDGPYTSCTTRVESFVTGGSISSGNEQVTKSIQVLQ